MGIYMKAVSLTYPFWGLRVGEGLQRCTMPTADMLAAHFCWVRSEIEVIPVALLTGWHLMNTSIKKITRGNSWLSEGIRVTMNVKRCLVLLSVIPLVIALLHVYSLTYNSALVQFQLQYWIQGKRLVRKR